MLFRRLPRLFALGVCGGSLLLMQACSRGSDATPEELVPLEPLPAQPVFTPDAGHADGNDDAKCAGALVTLSRVPVYMLVIMDGSGSMLDPLVPNGPIGLKWKAAKDALVSFVDDTAKAKNYSFAVGLFLFDGTKGVPDFTQVDVPIHYVDAQQATLLKNRVNGATPQGGTPLKRAIEGQLPWLESFVPSQPLKPNGKRVLLVITDGVPDGPSDIQPVVKGQCVKLLEDARKGPGAVTSFAVGVGDPSSSEYTYDEVFMGQMAVAGGAPADGCTPGWNQSSPANEKPCHFQITPGQKTAAQIRDEMLAAIEEVRGTVSNCQFPLQQADGSPGVPDPKKVNVVYTDADGNTTKVPQDPVNGWTYDDPANPTTVILHGDACKRTKSESEGKLSVELGCATRVE